MNESSLLNGARELPRRVQDDWKRNLCASFLVGLCCLVIYNLNGRAIASGDTYPARYLPFVIVKHQTFYLDPLAKVMAGAHGDRAYWMMPLPDGRFLSLYPVVQPALLAPFYVPAVMLLESRGWTEARLEYLAKVMEKLSASVIASIAAALLYPLLRRRVTHRVALVLTAAYAFGTTAWVVSSQALWQHGLAQLLIVGALLCLTGKCTTKSALIAGVACGLLAGNRPPDVILAAALGVYGLYWAGRKRAPLFAAAAAMPATLVLVYNLAVAGHIGGGYGRGGDASFFQHDLLAGVAGLLVSPTRGLFVFSPFLLFVFLAWRHLPDDRGERWLTLAVAIAVVLQIALYAKTDWRGGYSWGPRFTTDLVPLLVWMMAPAVAALRPVGRVIFLVLVAGSIAGQAVGAFCYTGETDHALFASGNDPKIRAAWNWRNSPLLSFKQGVAPADLVRRMRGSFDGLQSGGLAVSSVAAGDEIVATGWALAGDETPSQVAIVVDGKKTITSRSFHDRADVRAATGATNAAGWRIGIDTSRLAPGEHSLIAFAWSSPSGESHFLQERTLVVKPGRVRATASGSDDLGAHARIAAARIRENQHDQGFWLTAYTSGTRFEDAHPEMNTYLTALMIDLLDPVAAAAGVEESVGRARRHLTAQIERNGLVRYHGLPDAPWMGTLGCPITPDADDTALVWRVAPSRDRSLLASALATVEQYRTPAGLYRTWLAPRDAYQCLDPGSDPNPADLTIQMHLLQLLSTERPAAARALCNALASVVDDDRVWVYYRKAPLVPILRTADLRRAGCELDLPESRMRTDVAGQEVWLSVARLLTQPQSRRASQPDAERARILLLELAKDDFALVRTNPPFLYHNDLTATVPRYYWSADVGYALWLRLYHSK